MKVGVDTAQSFTKIDDLGSDSCFGNDTILRQIVKDCAVSVPTFMNMYRFHDVKRETLEWTAVLILLLKRSRCSLAGSVNYDTYM